MIQSILLIILGMFISLQAYSQETEKIIKSIDIHFTPSTLIDYTPRIRVGGELKRGNHFSYSLDLGYGNYFLNKNRLIFDGMWWNEDYNFFEVRPELKYHFNNPASYYDNYCALELFYIHMTDHMTNSYYHKDYTYNITHFDQADFLKNKLGLHLKAGCNIIAFNRLGVDIYLGLGVAWRQIRYQNVSNPTHGVHGGYEWYQPTYKFEGDRLIFHTTMGCKIGLILNKS